MDVRVEITGQVVVCKVDGRVSVSAPLAGFLDALVRRCNWTPLPEAIPEGVRFVRGRADVCALVLEEKPQVRTIRWLSDDSRAPFGQKASYRMARLAFPFVVVVVVFRAGVLTGFQQCFYRCSPLRRLSDPLSFPNLYNVAEGYQQKCWLCLANMNSSLAKLDWGQKVAEVRKHLWGAAFNRSSEIHEGMSYWQAMRVDPRVESLAAWEKASRKDPYFPLQVAWRPVGKTVGEVIDEMLSLACAPGEPQSAQDLAQLLHALPGARCIATSSLFKKAAGS